MAYNPFNLTGGPFLLLHILLFLIAAIASKSIADRIRPQGRRKTIDDIDSLAILTGGSTRYADTIAAKMLSQGSLKMIGKDGFGALSTEAGQSPAERSVLQLPQPMSWKMISETLNDYAGQTERRLTTDGLLAGTKAMQSIRFWAILPFLMVMAFGLTKLVIGLGRDKPVGFLIFFLIITAIVAVVRFFTIDRRTHAGREAAEEARLRFERLQRASTTDEMALAVALFGTGVMATSAYGDFHRMRHNNNSDSSGSNDSSSSGDSGGGCGGGGCGGCGS